MRELRGTRWIACAALLLPTLGLPMSAHADMVTTARAFNHCTRELAARLRVRVVVSHYQAQYADPLQIFVSSPQRMELTARSVHTHRVVARAVCAYNPSGTVVRLTPQSLAALPPVY
jgi:hypothetical protein